MRISYLLCLQNSCALTNTLYWSFYPAAFRRSPAANEFASVNIKTCSNHLVHFSFPFCDYNISYLQQSVNSFLRKNYIFCTNNSQFLKLTVFFLIMPVFILFCTISTLLFRIFSTNQQPPQPVQPVIYTSHCITIRIQYNN